MNHREKTIRLFLMFWVCCACTEVSMGAGDPSSDKRLHKARVTTGFPRSTALTINNIVSWIKADGSADYDQGYAASGLYPNRFEYDMWGGGSFTGRPVIYADGLIWAGKPFRDPGYRFPATTDSIRAGGQTYTPGTRAGWIVGAGASAAPVSETDPRARVYRIRRDYARYFPDEQYRLDAAILFHGGALSPVTYTEVDSIHRMYARDWREWPVDLGAPYIERNGQPGYQPPPPLSDYGFTEIDLITGHYDEPGVAGPSGDAPAAQVVWTVFNDLNFDLPNSQFRSGPLGLEVQCTMWAYHRLDAIDDSYFRRYRIINKGGALTGSGAFYIDSMYIGQWSDPDIGDFVDDLAGCDPLQNIGFAYNSSAIDGTFKWVDLPPPAVAYDMLQGPAVPGAPGDSAVVNFTRVFGRRNLGTTSFLPIPVYMLADDPYRPGPLYWYRLLRGYLPYSDANARYPSGPFPVSPFPVSGDPVTGQGFIDGLGTDYSPAPGDRRFVMGTGPFRMAPGDTQEVVIATVAGIGADNLSSVSVMRFNDRYAQSAQNLLFDVPTAPRPPTLKATALNGQIVLEWGSDQARVAATETPVIAGSHRFEGYAVYQLQSPGSSTVGRVRIATFDVANDVTRVLTEGINPTTGLPEYAVAQEGTNSGIRRNLTITEDRSGEITDPYARRLPLRNGQRYQFAVTAYNFADDVTKLPRSLESAWAVATVTPSIPFGAQLSAAPGDTVPLVHVKGSSDQPPAVYVVNPTVTNGNTYQLSFREDGDAIWMTLQNASTGTIRWTGSPPTGDDGPLLDGLMLKLPWRYIGMDQMSIPSGTRRWASSSGSIGLGLEGFSGAMGYARAIFPLTTVTPGSLHDVLLVLAATDSFGVPLNAGDPNVSYAYRYLENSSIRAARPEFVPFITHTSTLPWAYQGFAQTIPFAAFDTRTTPPTRLALGHLENNVDSGRVDGRYWPGVNTSNTSSGSAREWFVVFDLPYKETADTLLARDLSPSSRIPAMWLCTAARRSAPGFGANDRFLIISRHALSAADTFRFTAPAVDRSRKVQESSAARVGVFPNPYVCGSFLDGAYQGRFVTFNNLPQRATLRIYNLSGQLVRTLEKYDQTQFMKWDLANDERILVASGMYLIHVDMPEIGATKILKLAVVQEAFVR